MGLGLAFIALAGCSPVTPVQTDPGGVVPPSAQQAALEPCADPVDLSPETHGDALSQELAWAEDRAELVICRDKHAATVALLRDTLEALNVPR